MKRAISALAILMMVAALTGCTDTEASTPTGLVSRPVKTMIVGKGSATTTRSFPGVVEPAAETRIAFRVGGPLVRFDVAIGEQVSKGQVIAQIDSRDYELRVQAIEASLGEAKATLKAMKKGAREEDIAAIEAEIVAATSRIEEAGKNLARMERLSEEGAVAEASVDSAKTGYETAKAALKSVTKSLEKATSGARAEDIEAMQARLSAVNAELKAAKYNLGDTTLRAPLAGVIHEKLTENFETVAPGQPIVTIFDSSTPEVTVRIPEAIAASPGLIEAISCTIDAYPAEIFDATIKEIGQGSKAANQSYPLTVALRVPKKLNLYPGMAATLAITISDEKATETTFVPLHALASDPEGNSRVFIFDQESSTALPVKVETGIIIGDNVEVVEGIKAGDRIITAGARFLRPGQKIKLIDG